MKPISTLTIGKDVREKLKYRTYLSINFQKLNSFWQLMCNDREEIELI